MELRVANTDDAAAILAIKREIITTTTYFISSPNEYSTEIEQEKRSIE